MSGPLLTARKVADLLGVSPETVLRWTRRGELRGIRLPGTARGRLRYRPEDIDAWLEAHETGSGGTGIAKTPEPRTEPVEATLNGPCTTSRAPTRIRSAKTPAGPDAGDNRE